MEFYNLSYKFLQLAGLKISKNYLRERLESHPHYPSLKSLTDVLDEFQITNQAIKIDQKERWIELELPFLAHVYSNEEGEAFELVENFKSVKKKEFLKKWTGIVLMIGNQTKIIHEEHNEQYRKERRNKLISIFLIFLTMVGLITNQILSFTIVGFIHFILLLSGLLISLVVIAYTLGLKTDISDLVCKIEESGCNKVLNSKLGRFAGDIGLGDVSGIFFFALILYHTFSIFFTSYDNIQLLLVIYCFAFLLTLVSLIYQWTLKSWCKLCSLIILILWFQTANLGLYILNTKSTTLQKIENPYQMYLLLGICFLFSTFWIVIKRKIADSEILIHKNIQLRKWRQDPLWFDAILPLHRKIDDSLWEKEICFGRFDAPLQIIIVSDPYCEYCAKAHSDLEKIIARHPDDINVRIRFTLKSFNRQNKSYEAIFKILNAYEELVWKKNLGSDNILMKKIVSDWFKKKDFHMWEQLYTSPTHNNVIIDSMIKRSIAWSHQMDIYQTPSFFINGFEMPNPHTFKDLFLFVSEYIDILNSKRNQYS